MEIKARWCTQDKQSVLVMDNEKQSSQWKSPDQKATGPANEMEPQIENVGTSFVPGCFTRSGKQINDGRR